MENPADSGESRVTLFNSLAGSIGVSIISLLLVLFFGKLSVTQPNDHPPEERSRASAHAVPGPGAAVSPPTIEGREITIRGTRIVIPDVQLVDQNGKQVRLYEDLIKDKTVAIGFFYTRCTYICTRHGDLFSRLQKQLGARLDKDISLISINMDPQFDTTEIIARWGRDYGRRKGWTLLTGPVEEISKVLAAMTADTPGPKEEHGTFFYVGNDKTGSWDSMYVNMTPGTVAKRLNELSAASH